MDLFDPAQHDPAKPDTGSAADVIRRLVLPVYLPVLAVNGGTAMLVPVLPLYLRDQGLSYTMVTVVLAAAGLGSMLAQVPIGRILRGRSETEVMVPAVAVLGLSTALLGITGVAVMLVALRLAWGVGSVGWLLSRQTFLTRTVDPLIRGRAMSLFGGTTRVAFLIGPLLGGFVAGAYGYRAAFATTAVVTAAGLIPLLIWQRGARASSIPEPVPVDANGRSSLRDQRRVLTAAGAGQVCVMAARQGRFVVLPLIGASLGLSPGAIGLLIGIGSLADLLLFPAAGYLMDRFGRLVAIVPSFSLLGVGLFLLAAADGYAAVAAAATVIGIGNGLGSGTMLTLSSDLAPREAPSQFLAALGTIRDGGKIFGPLAVGWVADQAGLSAAAAALGVLAFAGIAILTLGVGETRDRTLVPTRA